MNVVIVGGGISGISAAKVVLKAGHHATIIESAPAPGGLMARIANCRVGFSTFYDEIRDAPPPYRHQRRKDHGGGKEGRGIPRHP